MTGPELTGSIRDEEPIARFLCNRSLFSRTARRLKQAAFLPRDGATSVFRIDGLSNRKVWDLGRERVSGPSNRTLHGHATLQVVQVRLCRLSLHADNEPPRHAEIRGWPSERAAQRFQAQQLADAAVLQLCSDDGTSPP